MLGSQPFGAPQGLHSDFVPPRKMKPSNHEILSKSCFPHRPQFVARTPGNPCHQLLRKTLWILLIGPVLLARADFTEVQFTRALAPRFQGLGPGLPIESSGIQPPSTALYPLAISGGRSAVIAGASMPAEEFEFSIPDYGYQAFLWTQAGGVLNFGGLASAGELQVASLTTAISADGSTVVGVNSYTYPYMGIPPGHLVTSHGFRYTKTAGMESLGFLTDQPGEFSWPTGVSADGSVVVGYSDVFPQPYGTPRVYHAFIWTPTSGMTDLGTPFVYSQPPYDVSEAMAVSSDGSIVAGTYTYSAAYQVTPTPPKGDVFVWTQAGGLTHRALPLGEYAAISVNLSADGTIIVGLSNDSAGNTHAFRLKAARSELLPLLPGDTNADSVLLSANGAVVVGNSMQGTTTNPTHAFRWTKAEGTQTLGSLAVGSSDLGTLATSVSENGRVIVGTSQGQAFLWTKAWGIRPLQYILEKQYHLAQALTGWTLATANALSPDGKTISGLGVNPSGQTEGWVADLH